MLLKPSAPVMDIYPLSLCTRTHRKKDSGVLGKCGPFYYEGLKDIFLAERMLTNEKMLSRNAWTFVFHTKCFLAIGHVGTARLSTRR
jgi:hypothetical protein